jgi:hypothetical protein
MLVGGIGAMVETVKPEVCQECQSDEVHNDLHEIPAAAVRISASHCADSVYRHVDNCAARAGGSFLTVWGRKVDHRHLVILPPLDFAAL